MTSSTGTAPPATATLETATLENAARETAGLWTPRAVEARMRAALATIQRVERRTGPARPRSAMPAVIRQAWDAYATDGAAAVPMLVSVGNRDVTAADAVFPGWLLAIEDRATRRVVAAAVGGVRLSEIARGLRVHRNTARNRLDRGLAEIAAALNRGTHS